MRILLALLLLSSPAFAAPTAPAPPDPPTPHSADSVGATATVASARAPGGYNNYCQTWRDTRAKDRALFRACLANE